MEGRKKKMESSDKTINTFLGSKHRNYRDRGKYSRRYKVKQWWVAKEKEYVMEKWVRAKIIPKETAIKWLKDKIWKKWDK